jgi:hypothetical protein
MWPPYPRVELLISQLFGFCGLGQTVENQISLPTIKAHRKRDGGEPEKSGVWTHAEPHDLEIMAECTPYVHVSIHRIFRVLRHPFYDVAALSAC